MMQASCGEPAVAMALRAAKACALALLLAAGTAGAGVCRGGLNASGLEGAAFASGHGGDVLGNQLKMHHNSGFSITTSCKDDWEPANFKLFQVLGKTLTYTVDLSQVGCACNLAVYFVPLPARDLHGNPSKGTCSYISYYCDANAACGQFCPELDIMQANKYAFAATPRKCDSPANNGHYTQCDRHGCGQNTNSMGVMDFGPGSRYTIDTERPFDVHTDFYGHREPAGGGVFKGMVTRLRQGEKQLVLRHSACSSYLQSMAGVMAAGMSLRIAYWGADAKTMAWLDDPPCSGSAGCGGGNAGPATVSNIRVGGHPDGQWRPSGDRGAETPSAGAGPDREAGWRSQLSRLQALPAELLHQLQTMPQRKLGMVLVGASVLFCVPGIIAICGYYIRRRRQEQCYQQQRNLVIPMQQPHMQTYAVNPKVFSVREEKGVISSLFSCCCRRDIPYVPFSQRGPHYGGHADFADWNMHHYGPQPQVAPRPFYR